MNNSIQLFRLEEKLEIIDLEHIHTRDIELSQVSSYQKVMDYIELEERLQAIGEKGEQYVYESEKARLIKAGSVYVNKISRAPAQDPRNGYDIDSYTETGKRIHIEVKSTTGDLTEPFYMTANEREKAKEVRKEGGIYQIHRVYNIENDDEIGVVVYNDESSFAFEDVLYCVKII